MDHRSFVKYSCHYHSKDTLMQHLNIACFGYGKTTRAIAKAHGPCTFFDDKISKPFMDEDGNTAPDFSTWQFNFKFSLT